MYRSQTSIANEHDFDTTFTAEIDANQTDVALITPTSGKLIKVTGIYISTEGATSAGQKIRLKFNTSDNTICTFFSTTTPASLPMPDIVVRGARNEVLSITSDLGADKNYFIVVNYKEE